MPEPTDEELMLRVQRGDVQAFEVLYRRFRQPLYAFVVRLVRDPAAAADLYQETFLQVLQGAARYRAGRRFSTWLFSIAHHLAVDLLRAGRDRVPVDQVAGRLAWQGEDPSERVVRHQTETAAWRALEDLPMEQRAVVLLRVVQDCSEEETARITGIPVGTVKSRLHYALAKLRERVVE
jgi:RNA polymerase sigma-70 factor (ECF subfamily)